MDSEVETSVQRTLFLSKMNMFLSLYVSDCSLPCQDKEIEELLKETKENIKTILVAKKWVGKKIKKSEGKDYDLESFMADLMDIENRATELKKKLKGKSKRIKRSISRKFNDLFTGSEGKKLTNNTSSRKLNFDPNRFVGKDVNM